MKAWVLALPLVCLLWSGESHGSPIYPVTMRSKLELTQPPACTLCHQSDLGGAGSVTTRFGRALLANGVTGANATSLLDSALDAFDEARTDSDGDLIPDIDELRMGSDPNDGPGPMNGEEELPIPRTGCSVSFAHEPRFGTDSAWLLAVAAVCVRGVLARRRRG